MKIKLTCSAVLEITHSKKQPQRQKKKSPAKPKQSPEVQQSVSHNTVIITDIR